MNMSLLFLGSLEELTDIQATSADWSSWSPSSVLRWAKRDSYANICIHEEEGETGKIEILQDTLP